MISSATFCLTLHSTNLAGRAAKITSDIVDLSTVPAKYHEFADIFSKVKAETLTFYHLYNL